MKSVQQTRFAEIEEAALRQSQIMLQSTLKEAVIARFPKAPIALVHDIRRITDPQQLQQFIIAVIRAAGLAEFERALTQASSSTAQ